MYHGGVFLLFNRLSSSLQASKQAMYLTSYLPALPYTNQMFDGTWTIFIFIHFFI